MSADQVCLWKQIWVFLSKDKSIGAPNVQMNVSGPGMYVNGPNMTVETNVVPSGNVYVSGPGVSMSTNVAVPTAHVTMNAPDVRMNIGAPGVAVNVNPVG